MTALALAAAALALLATVTALLLALTGGTRLSPTHTPQRRTPHAPTPARPGGRPQEAP